MGDRKEWKKKTSGVSGREKWVKMVKYSRRMKDDGLSVVAELLICLSMYV